MIKIPLRKIIYSLQYILLFAVINIVIIFLNLILRNNSSLDSQMIFEKDNIILFSANVLLLLVYLLIFYLVLVREIKNAILLVVIYIQCLMIPISFILGLIEIFIYIYCLVNILIGLYYMKSNIINKKYSILFIIFNVLLLINIFLRYNNSNYWFILLLLLSNIFYIVFPYKVMKKDNLSEKEKIGIICYIINLIVPFCLIMGPIIFDNLNK